MEKILHTRRARRLQSVHPAVQQAAIESLESRVMMSVATRAATSASASVSGVVFDDLNGNGTQNQGEPGIGGVTVYVDLQNAAQYFPGDPSAVTNANGSYTITGIPSGSYDVYEQVPAGYTQLSPANNGGILISAFAGQVATGYNFSLQAAGAPAPASISGNVFNDVNGDGVENNGETGLAGATVYLDPANTGQYTAGDPTATTDASGNYVFTGLSAGTYSVGLLLPNGESETAPAVGGNIVETITAGQSVTGANFGVAGVPTTAQNSISGTVFDDLNSNGVEDNGESGISGITVYVDTNDSGAYAAGDPVAVTDAQGDYTLSNLLIGSNLVRVELPAGYTQTAPAGNAGINVNLSGTAGVAGQDFGLLYSPPAPNPATITGTVFNDANGNELQDNGEVGVAGATVYVDLNNTGSYVAGDPVATTNAQGVYTITGVTPGSYFLRETAPAGDTQTTPAANAGIAVSLSSGQTLAAQNFGLSVPTTPAKETISGTVFNDANHDGVQDNGEVGVAGVVVYMDPSYSHKLIAGDQTAVTDANGNFTFSNVPADPEILRIVLPSGAVQTLPANGVGDYVGKNTGQTLTGENFGIYYPPAATGSITGTVFNDLNGDHVQETGELNLGGQTVFLDLNNDGKLDPGDPIAVTNSSGVFTFASLNTGSYTVDVLPASGYRQTLPIAGGTKVTVSANSTVSAGKFGVTTTAYVGGVLFNDLNGNGVQNAGENGIAGWKVYIDLNNDGKFESNEPSAVTNSVGYWYFRSVAPGTYTIRVVAPSGWTTTHAYTVTLTNGEYITNGAIGVKA